jgi:hypothetical protein
MTWLFEAVDASASIYRISCRWGQEAGYLTRDAMQQGDGTWTPSTDINLLPLNTTWTSQQWRLEYLHDQVYKINCRWGDGSFLTRKGIQNFSNRNNWTPTS